MIGFKDYITEGKYPNWVRIAVGGLVIKIVNLSRQIEQEPDPVIQNKMISKQNKLVGYITGLGVGVSSNDTALLQKMKPNKK